LNKLKRAGMFTDIHFGRKNNSKIHNEDCARFIQWFITQCKKYEVDHIVFLGDWFEERTSLDTLTITIAMNCAIELDKVGVPVFFIVGNHDLYYRDSRDVYASYIYKPLSNFILIDKPLVTKHTLRPTLYSPFLFEEEYAELSGYFDIPIWMGHFEFKGFVLTGDTVVKEHGPDPNKFTAPDHIFSGHFHKRQHSRNIDYIGNTFPMDFGDANDFERGMAIYDYESDEIQFNLTEALRNPSILKNNARVKCIADTEITFSENSEIKQKLMEDYGLREFNIEEAITISVSESELTEEDLEKETTSSLVRKGLLRIDSNKIDNQILVEEYDKL
jgi:DNA repair exonuclease SbcCD nuclease subunit